MARKFGILLAFAAVCTVLTPAPSGAASARRAAALFDDPLAPMIRRIDDALQTSEVDGVTMDWRYSVIPSEEIRQTVVCQVLAYVELSRLDPRPRLRIEIVRHADFLVSRLDSIRSHTPFDGMLAYALLASYEITRESRFLDAGTRITSDLLAIPTSQCVLNGGLMVAMAAAEDAWLTGESAAEQKAHDIVAQLAPYQNADGSFPHWCWGSRDIHYTAWMAMELIHVARRLDDSRLPQLLGTMSAFLEGRIAPDGRAIYEESCPDYPGCMQYYYSRATGCPQDLDSRGWTVEPAYCGLLFDHEGSAKYPLVMSFLDSLETGGTIPDLYGYWPPPSDPEYPWTTADTSVVCSSIILWTLSTEVADRVRRGVPVDLVLDDLIDTTSVVPPAPPPAPAWRALSVSPNPARGSCLLRFSLAAPGRGSLTVLDAGGRRVRTLASGVLQSGDHAPRWDGRDEGGRAVPEGVYFASLRLAGGTQTRRLVLLR